MKKGLTIIFFFISIISLAQVDSIGLKEAMKKLDHALLQKDEPALKSLLHKNTSYGHSNGWVQNKTDVLNDFKSGKIVYDKIEISAVSILDLGKKWATVKMNSITEGKVNGNAFNLKMHVLQIWTKTKNGWQLYARQSAKI